MSEHDIDEIKARLDYLEAAMQIERTNGYMTYAEFMKTMPDGVPPELAAAGTGPQAAMQLARTAGISAAFAQVVLKFFEIRE